LFAGFASNEGADIRGFGAGKRCSLAPERLKTGQNPPVLFTDRLTDVFPKMLIHSGLQASAG
jgi:hypothetical protein